MKLPSFLSLKKTPDDVLTRAARQKVERRVVDSLRTVSTFLTRVADLVEAARLARQGYEGQGKFVERSDLERQQEEERARQSRPS